LDGSLWCDYWLFALVGYGWLWLATAGNLSGSIRVLAVRSWSREHEKPRRRCGCMMEERDSHVRGAGRREILSRYLIYIYINK
jgi:hypothetical protein